MNTGRIVLLVLIFAIAAYTVAAQTPRDSINPAMMNQLLDATNKKYTSLQHKDTTLETIAALSKNDSLLQKDLYAYYHFGLEHRRQTFVWNLTSGKITFWVVILLVFTGVTFAAFQFYIAMKDRRQFPKDAPMDLSTQLEAGKDGLKVSSPVLGVIILVISLLFFYLYLAFVYPIHEIF